MHYDDDNPYLANEIPGTWDIPFKKWAFGICASLILLRLGLKVLFSGSCNVPVPERGSGITWMALNGAGAYWFGLLEIGCAIYLHGHYYWRFHARLWRHFELIQGGGAVLSGISVIVTVIYLWRTHF